MQRLALQTLVQCKDYPLSSAILSSELSGKNEVAALLKYQSIRKALLSTLDVIVKVVYDNTLNNPPEILTDIISRQHNPVQEKLLALDDIDFCARVLIVVRDASRFMALVAERRDDAQSLLNLLQIVSICALTYALFNFLHSCWTNLDSTNACRNRLGKQL